MTAPPSLHTLLKEARYLKRMVAQVYDVTRPGTVDPMQRSPPGAPIVVGYRFKLSPGGGIKPKGGKQFADRLCDELGEKVRTATYASHNLIVCRMKTLVAQKELTTQIIQDLGDLQVQLDGIEALGVFTPALEGMSVCRAAGTDKGLEITFTERQRAFDLLASFNGALAPYINASLAELQEQMTVIILRSQRPAP